MAIYHLSAQVIDRKSGRSSVAAAAYRLGVDMVDERTGLRHDYTRKRGVDGWEQMTPANAPEWMADPSKCWNSVERVEKRKDAQLCREVNMALPRELTAEQMKALTRSWVKSQCVDQGMVATVAWHHLDGDNPHAHVMVSMREITAEGWGKKIRKEWTKERKDELTQWRETWAAEANKALELAGSRERIDHRSLKEQGKEQEPQRHMGPKATAIERRGGTPARARYIHPTPAGMGQEQARKDRQREQAATPATKRQPTPQEAWKAQGQRLLGPWRKARDAAERVGQRVERLRDDASRKYEQVHKAERVAYGRQQALELAQKREQYHRQQGQSWRESHRLRAWLGLVPGWVREQDAEATAAAESAERRRGRLAEASEQAKQARQAWQAASRRQQQAEKRAAVVVAEWRRRAAAMREHVARNPEKPKPKRELTEAEKLREWAKMGLWSPAIAGQLRKDAEAKQAAEKPAISERAAQAFVPPWMKPVTRTR